jgi:nitroimidazol reductase NimA-like FMN-containing flavoprotein (pyridoxamine 5'-phosphate oxidase superfamily)
VDFDPAFTQVRRQDRVVADDAWIAEFLNRTPFGVLAMAVADQPFVNTNIFVYDPKRHAVYIHHADAGRMVAALAHNPKVCFTAAEMGRLLPAPRSRGFSLEYASVVVFGQACRVDEPAEMLYGLRLIMDKYAPHLTPGADYHLMDESELHGVTVYRVDVAGWSAKRKQAAEDFPGAYDFAQVRDAQ